MGLRQPVLNLPYAITVLRTFTNFQWQKQYKVQKKWKVPDAKRRHTYTHVQIIKSQLATEFSICNDCFENFHRQKKKRVPDARRRRQQQVYILKTQLTTECTIQNHTKCLSWEFLPDVWGNELHHVFTERVSYRSYTMLLGIRIVLHVVCHTDRTQCCMAYGPYTMLCVIQIVRNGIRIVHNVLCVIQRVLYSTA